MIVIEHNLEAAVLARGIPPARAGSVVRVTEPLLDAEEHGRWRAEADRALHGARVQAEAEIYNWACFAAEQAAQLALEGLLHGLGRAPWGHDLVRLCAMLWRLESNSRVRSPTLCVGSAATTSRRAIPTPIRWVRRETATVPRIRAMPYRTPERSSPS
jgi:hypothetical protein